MKLSISRSQESLWVWLFWGVGAYLALELGAGCIAAQVLNKTAEDLAGPYLAFAIPWAILAPLIWWLRKREEQGVSPKRVARGWGMAMALFGIAVVVAVFYSGTALGLMDPTNVAGGFIAALLISIPILSFGMYYRALRSISARAVSKHESA